MYAIPLVGHRAGRLLECCRHAGQSLASTIVHTSPTDPLDYKQILAIGDESTYEESTASWDQPPSVSDLCYVGVPRSLYHLQPCCHGLPRGLVYYVRHL
jgi:hypothetical protein